MTDPANTATAAVADLVAAYGAARVRIDSLETTVAQGVDVVLAIKAENADLKARLDSLNPWQELHTYDLTRDEGWQINTGTRPTVDSSRGRKEMVQFGPDGLRLSAKRVGDQILSCDIIAKFVPLPTFRAVEMDVQVDGYIGPGMFPAFYWSKSIEGGGGEFDGVEYMGGQPNADYKWKMTAIGLPATSPLKQIQKPLVPFLKANGIDPLAKNTWRWEHADGKVDLFINGLLAATITRAEYDAKYGAGSYDKQYQRPELHGYLRSTWQVGPRLDGKPGGMGGVVPLDWTGSSFLISRLVVEVPR